MNRSYFDLLPLPHHRSPTRPHLSRSDRAAQFAPFSALSGLDDSIQETTRQTLLPEQQAQARFLENLRRLDAESAFSPV